MSDLLLFVAQAVAGKPPQLEPETAPTSLRQTKQADSSSPARPRVQATAASRPRFSRTSDRLQQLQRTVIQRPQVRPQLSPPPTLRPQSGAQLYAQRQAALQAGTLFTRVQPDSFQAGWQNAVQQPTYEQWQQLLRQEASAIAAGQGRNRLTVVVGDSLSLWLPPEMLSRDRFWLNQAISGDTTSGILQRLSNFADARPDTVHVMAGINDLKSGASDAEILANMHQIMTRLRQQHPQARIVIHSILPTRWENIPSSRTRHLNRQIAYLAAYHRLSYLDLQPQFSNARGTLRKEFTTDGLHLNRLGYQAWQPALLEV